MNFITPTKTKTIIFFVVAVLVVGLLMIVGTFFDLQISREMTKNSLKAGEYYTNDFFAVLGEAFGSMPIWIAMCIASCLTAFCVAKTKKSKWYKVIFCTLFALLAIFVSFYCVKEVFEYLFEYRNPDFLESSFARWLTVAFSFLIFGAIAFLCRKCNPSPKTWRFIVVVVCSCALFVLIETIKINFGRVRFRAINFLQDESLFSPWYVVNGKRTVEGLNIDACKSFPSGHTFSAGIFSLIVCLSDFFDRFKKKCVVILLWSASIGFTACVGLSRIVAGAHFLTDVTVGGALSFFGVVFFREAFLHKFANFKVFSKTEIKNV